MYVRGQNTSKILFKMLYQKGENQFNLKNDIYLKMRSISKMKYLNYVITLPQYFFTRVILPKKLYPTKNPPVSRNWSAVTQMSR